MRPLLKVESNDGYNRYLYVQAFNLAEIDRARMIFSNYKSVGVILEGTFDDEVWTLTDEVRRTRLDFSVNLNDYKHGAGRWIGCTRKSFIVYMKTYVVFQMGQIVLFHLYETVRLLKKLVEMDAETASLLKSSGVEIEFLSYIPDWSESRDSVIEALEEQNLTERWMKKAPRQLSDFRSYLLFDKELREFWSNATEEEKATYFPVYLWWKLTAVLPLRPTEFLLTPADCVMRKNGKDILTVRRSRMKKKGRHRVTYTIAEDYEECLYEIPADLADTIREYQGHFPTDGTIKVPTLFPPGPYGCSGHMTYAQMNRLLKNFIMKELHSNVEIHLGDTRHLAMINLMLSGGSPTICKALADHEDINISANYYSNLSRIIESTVYEFYHGNEQGATLDGTMFFPLQLPANSIRIQDGWCDYPAVRDGDISQCLQNYSLPGTMGDCINCTHFFPDKRGFRMRIVEDRKRAVDESTAFLIQMVEQVRKGQELQESIASAMARLQQDSLKYMSVLRRKYEMELK